MKRSEGKVDWGPLQKQRSSNIPNQLQATKSPHINLPTVREEQTSIGGSTRCIGVPHAIAQEKSYLDEGWAKLVDPPIRSGVRQSPATDAPRKSSTASPTDELARIRRERQSRPGSKGISANEHSQRYREKSIRQDFNGASIDEIGPPKRDKALPLHGSTEAPSTKSSLPTVVIADVSRRSTGSRSRGASSDEYLLMKRDRSTPIRRSGDTRSNETDYRVAMVADQSRRSTVSGSKAASMEDQPRTRQDFALPHPGSTDALLRARCSPIPSSVNPSRKSNVSADSAATKSVRIPRKPEMIPLRQHDPSVRSKDRTRVEFPMTTTMQDSGPAISRDDTEKANNLSVIVSGHLPASPSMPLTPKRGSALGGYDSKFKYRPSRISGLGSPEHVEDRNPPTTLRHDSHSLLMESQKQIHSSLPTSQRDQKTGLPFCGVKLMY